MKKITLFLIIATSISILGCGVSKDTYTERNIYNNTLMAKNTYVLPYQDPDRLTGSVSPRAEEANPYLGSQSPKLPRNNNIDYKGSPNTIYYNIEDNGYGF